MKKILEDGEGAAIAPSNNTDTIPDQLNPPFFPKKRKPQLLKNILKRRGPK